jgi:threonine dehydratase
VTTAADVEAAASRLADVVLRTPVEPCPRLSEQLGLQVWLKREDLQVVRSYKLRGAYNLMLDLTPSQRHAGVVCASAGNHAQGVAFSCRALGVHGRIYLPRTTPRQKLERVAAIGGSWVDIHVTGDSYDDASHAATNDAATSGSVLVPPFDDPRTIAGQGTVAVEVAAQLGRNPDVVVVPVGGGGLAAGIAAWCAERSPRTRVIGVEPAGAASMQAALADQPRVPGHLRRRRRRPARGRAHLPARA